MTEAADRPRVSVAAAVAAFLVAGALAMTAIAAATIVLIRRQANADAVREARMLAAVEATDVVGPLLSDPALVAGSTAQASLDRVVRRRVLDADVVRVKIWDANGVIRYSDDRSLIGARFVLGAPDKAALRTGRSAAEITDLRAAENRDERRFGRLLQVYLPLRTTSGRRVLFETYQRYDAIVASARRLWGPAVVAVAAGLLLLYVVQAPLAYRLARRLRRAQHDREQALVAALAASDGERRRIAADLHDGVVQGLVGVSYTLAAAAERPGHPHARAVFDTAARELRSWVRELRSLIVTIVPPKLHEAGLRAALDDLTAMLSARGIRVTTDVQVEPGLDRDSEMLAFRVAQEAVRNVIRHAHASNVAVATSISRTGELAVEVVDDGRGVGEGVGHHRRDGGQGLALLSDLARAYRGNLAVGTPDTGVGTRVRLTLPTQRQAGDQP